jgi:CRP/FNR family transcriptional regulator, cyclic AMP receptor protein
MSSPRPAGPPIDLATHPFFEGFGESFLAAAGRNAWEVTFDTGSFLVREGDPADSFFLVREGKVALELGAPDRPHQTIQTIGPGEVLGWSWLLSPHRWRLDARAVKPTRAWALDAQTLRDALDARPEDGYRFLLRLLPIVAQRLENTRIQLLDLHGH